MERKKLEEEKILEQERLHEEERRLLEEQKRVIDCMVQWLLLSANVHDWAVLLSYDAQAEEQKQQDEEKRKEEERLKAEEEQRLAKEQRMMEEAARYQLHAMKMEVVNQQTHICIISNKWYRCRVQ